MKNQRSANRTIKALRFMYLLTWHVITLSVLSTTLSAQAPEIVIEDMSTINLGAPKIVRQDDGSLAIRQYKIGELAKGGIVFWVDESGEHGLVAAPSDQSSGIEWSNNAMTTAATGGNTMVGVGGGISAGAANTMFMISKDPADISAARVCADLLINEYGDWYMPSKGELFLMYQNLYENDLGDFAQAFYWSSTEDGSTHALRISFIDQAPGVQASGIKTSNSSLRAIRAF